jgi:hypothetical protein
MSSCHHQTCLPVWAAACHDGGYSRRVRRAGGETFAFLPFEIPYPVTLTRLRSSSYLEGRWEGKGTYVFYLELVTDLLHLCVYVVFFFIVFTNYGLPLHLARATRPPCSDLPLRPMRPMRPRCRWVHERKLAPWLGGRRCRCMEQGIGRACSQQHRACFSGLILLAVKAPQPGMSQRWVLLYGTGVGTAGSLGPDPGRAGRCGTCTGPCATSGSACWTSCATGASPPTSTSASRRGAAIILYPTVLQARRAAGGGPAAGQRALVIVRLVKEGAPHCMRLPARHYHRGRHLRLSSLE